MAENIWKRIWGAIGRNPAHGAKHRPGNCASGCYCQPPGAGQGHQGKSPENPVRAALLAAQDDPGKAPAFFKVFLAAECFSVAWREPDGSVHLVPFTDGAGQPFVPIWTAREGVPRDRPEGSHRAAFTGKQLLEMAREHRCQVVLDPGLPQPKVFPAEQVARVLDRIASPSLFDLARDAGAGAASGGSSRSGSGPDTSQL